MKTTWILEREIFRDQHDRLYQALDTKGIDVIDWKDEWIDNCEYPDLKNQHVVFHGSLGNAALIKNKRLWNPGVYCNIGNFKCTSWYPKAEQWLFQQNWKVTTVKKLVDNPNLYISHIATKEFFVRPNSSLKPFSGRVLSKDNISLQALDFGFYFDNHDEEVLVASLQKMKQEWRYVVCNRKVITGSSYIANNRAADNQDWQGKPLDFAQEIADSMVPPDDVYVLDVCDSEDGLRLLELNPFSGADLYNCDREAIVESIGQFLKL